MKRAILRERAADGGEYAASNTRSRPIEAFAHRATSGPY
jgi:hypothetical protein